MEDKKLIQIVHIGGSIKKQDRKIEKLKDVLSKKLAEFSLEVAYVQNGCNPALKKTINFELDITAKKYLEKKLQDEIGFRADLISKLDEIIENK